MADSVGQFELFGVVGVLVTVTAVFPLFLLPATIITALYVVVGYSCMFATYTHSSIRLTLFCRPDFEPGVSAIPSVPSSLPP